MLEQVGHRVEEGEIITGYSVMMSPIGVENGRTLKVRIEIHPKNPLDYVELSLRL